MYKTIFVPATGSDADAAVFATALTLARPFAAHMHFCHVQLQPTEPVSHSPHVEFGRGPAIADALEYLRKQGNALCVNARVHYEEFCETHGLPILQDPSRAYTVTASWSEQRKDPVEHLLRNARCSDLTVIGRARPEDDSAGGVIETLLLQSGRPVVIAAEGPPRAVASETVVVGWKETAESARAVSSAMPLLEKAKRVIVMGVAEDRCASLEALSHVARELAWHSIAAEVRVIPGEPGATARNLLEKATELAADLLIVGGFGSSRQREELCGGVTRSLIECATLPVFMMH